MLFNGKTDQEVIEIVRGLHNPELLLSESTSDAVALRTLTNAWGDTYTAVADVAEDGALSNGRILDWRGHDVTKTLKM